MIEIRISRKERRMTVKGHANAKKNEMGHDLVCCAVSALAHGYHYAAEQMGYEMACVLGSGLMDIKTKEDDRKMTDLDLMWIDAVFEGYIKGLKMIEDAYPNQVKMVDY